MIEGFKTPFGLELLTTVLWVARENPVAGGNVHQIIAQVHDWNRRKRELFTPEQIQVAWERLRIGDTEPVPA